jgi:sRNA-binding regulator protein Hfq
MMVENLNDYIGKKIKIVLSNGFIYRGIVQLADNDFIQLITNSGQTLISVSQVCSIEEER